MQPVEHAARDLHRRARQNGRVDRSDGQPEQVRRWGLRPFEPNGGRSLCCAPRSHRTNRYSSSRMTFLRPGSAPGNRNAAASNSSRRRRSSASREHGSPVKRLARVRCAHRQAYPDIAPFWDRHMAVIPEDDWMDWLQGSRSAGRCARSAWEFQVSGPNVRWRRTCRRQLSTDPFTLQE